MKKLHTLFVACAIAAAIPVVAHAEVMTAKFATDNVFTPAFKSLPGDPAKPLFVVTGGTPQVQDGKLVLGNGRITVGAVAEAGGGVAQSSGTDRPAGTLDLSKPYKITVKIAEATSVASGKDNFFIYVNNSTTRQADSPLGAASQIVKVAVSSLKPGDNVFSGSVGDAKSFLQLRAESGALVKIESITIAPE